MNIERLLILADWLDKVPSERLEMTTWANVDVAYDAVVPAAIDDPADPECGFAGCAVGWGAMCPALRAQGLTLDRYGGPSFSELPKYDFIKHRSWDAVQEFFGIGPDVASVLFSRDGYIPSNPTPADVATRIRDLIAGKSIFTPVPGISTEQA